MYLPPTSLSLGFVNLFVCICLKRIFVHKNWKKSILKKFFLLKYDCTVYLVTMISCGGVITMDHFTDGCHIFSIDLPSNFEFHKLCP